jgi:HK97 family phage prohead protease
MPEQKHTFAPQIRSFDLNRSSINEDSRTVDVVFSTDTDKVERWFGIEILDHSPKSVRMDRLKNAAPLLLDHNSREQIGVIESAEIKGKTGTATVRFSKSAKGEEIFQDVRDGIRSKVSVGYRVHQVVLERSDKATGRDTYRVTDWEPFEISLVSVPADDSAGVRGENPSSIFGQRAAELSTIVTMSKPAETQERAAEVVEQAPVITAVETPQARALEPVKPQLSEDEISKLADKRAADEIERREEIAAVGRAFNLPEDEVRKAIKDKESLDAFKLRTIDNLAAKHPAFSVGRVADVPAGPEKGTRAAMLTSFAEAAKPVLAARGINIIIPDYSQEREIQRKYIDGPGDQFHRSMSGAVTLIDVAKLDAGIGAPLISEVAVLAPETRVFPVDVISGGSVELSVNLTSATVGFRNANEGTTPSIGTFETRLFQTQVIEHPVVIDIQGVLNASKDPARVMAATARTVLEGVMKHIGVQTWYGGTAQSGTDAKAAPGLLAQSNTATTHVVDADGSTALTSVYMVRLGDSYCDHVYGNGTTLNMGEWMEETVESAAGKKLRALVSYLSGRVAPRLSNKNALVRIKKVGTDNNKKLTDLLLYSAYEKFLSLGQEPNAIFMTPRSLEQLRASRTATSEDGKPAPIPDSWGPGIPIYLTNSISHAETV